MRRLVLFIIAMFILAYFVPINKATSPAVVHQWTVTDSKAYARDKVLAYADKQWACLDKLWMRESNWSPKSYNKIKVMGRNAGGIPQILGMSIKTQPTEQIDRGLNYIIYRYGTPCNALAYHYKKGWY
jgi:hypothetical protein